MKEALESKFSKYYELREAVHSSTAEMHRIREEIEKEYLKMLKGLPVKEVTVRGNHIEDYEIDIFVDENKKGKTDTYYSFVNDTGCGVKVVYKRELWYDDGNPEIEEFSITDVDIPKIYKIAKKLGWYGGKKDASNM